MISPQAFINKYNGSRILDPTLPISQGQAEWRYQCVSLIKQYLRECYNISPGAWGNAKDYWINPNPGLLPAFVKVAATDVHLGDIVIYPATASNDAGHIAIGVGGGKMLEQNGGAGTGSGTGVDAIRIVNVRPGMSGVLRPKGGIVMDKEGLTLLHRLALMGADPGPQWLAAYEGKPYMEAANSLRGDAPYSNPTRRNLDKIFANWQQVKKIINS